jgi:CubicO group peptidase (beta-lactamase class C family)
MLYSLSLFLLFRSHSHVLCANTGPKPHVVSYSNYGYAILGAAIANAWESDYHLLLKHRILLQLDMNLSETSWRKAKK